MFYNTGIGTYVWIVTNRKAKGRKGKIQLIDARECWQPMRRSMGNKRRLLDEDDIKAIVCEYGNFAETKTSKIFTTEEFGFKRVPIERPLRLVYQMSVERKSDFLDALPHLLDDVQAIDRELGRTPREDWSDFDQFMSDLLARRGSRWKRPELKRFRDVFTDVEPDARPVIAQTRRPRQEPNARIWGWFDVEEQQVLPHVDDAWANRPKIRTGYEINFNRYFYEYTPPRPLAEIDADLKELGQTIIKLLGKVTD